MTKSAPLARLGSRLRRIRITSRMQWKKWTNYTDHGLTHGMQQQPPEVSAAAGVVERGPTLDIFCGFPHCCESEVCMHCRSDHCVKTPKHIQQRNNVTPSSYRLYDSNTILYGIGSVICRSRITLKTRICGWILDRLIEGFRAGLPCFPQLTST